MSKNITFDCSIAHRKGFQYGKNLIGTTHGDGAKHQDLPLLMATEFPLEWSQTKHGDGSKGWHVERGAPVKPTGGRILVFESDRFEKDGQKKTYKNIDSTKFPL
jgi:hypothetical protein